jgi:hypothetical protein
VLVPAEQAYRRDRDELDSQLAKHRISSFTGTNQEATLFFARQKAERDRISEEFGIRARERDAAVARRRANLFVGLTSQERQAVELALVPIVCIY